MNAPWFGRKRLSEKPRRRLGFCSKAQNDLRGDTQTASVSAIGLSKSDHLVEIGRSL
jgi:hypothetical protein